ncbi:MAG: hypothetical protein BAJALOKI1v1_140004 [Promethearchaeota archaeon]|nr:MAG: hypothetical protein BAJALOKI1v1_140004 [Candidatus Lokiarchaeota archaeon]
MSEIDLTDIKRMMERGEYQKALDELISSVHDDNYDQLPQILEGIVELQTRGALVRDEQLDKIKPYIVDFDENIQDYAVQIYTHKMESEMESLYNNMTLLTSKISEFELGIREKVVSFLVKSYNTITNKEKSIIEGLINCLTDEAWNVRMEVIRFLDELLVNKPHFIKQFENNLKVLYEEKDVDVKKEGLDLLLRLFIKTYDIEDLENLIREIPNNEWPIQEKLIFLIGKLGIHRKDLVEPNAMNLLYLLDDDDFLVREAIKEIIEEILEVHEHLFDDAFLNAIENDDVENLDIIEEILKTSVLKKGFERFYYFFTLNNPNSNKVIRALSDVIKKINLSHPSFIESLISQLTNRVLKNLTEDNYIKLMLIIRLNPQENIYLQCYQILNEIDFINNPEAERRRRLVIEYLLEQKPELNFSRVKKWIEAKILDGPINIKDISNKFNIREDQIQSYIKKLIENGELNAIFSNNIIAANTGSTFEGEDLLFLKKWDISKNDEDPSMNDIKLFIHIRNISQPKAIITNLDIEIEYPSDSFNVSLEEQSERTRTLTPDQNLLLTYKFQKKGEKNLSPEISNIKIVFNYQKEGKNRTIEKYLDVLLV